MPISYNPSAQIALLEEQQAIIQQEISLTTSHYSRRKVVIDIVDNELAPPTENEGDRYIIDNGGASHPDWDGAAANSIVEFLDGVWVEEVPIEGWVTYNDTQNKDCLYVNDGSPMWEARNIATSDHNSLAGIDDGDIKHLTATELAVVQSTSGTNTGDQNASEVVFDDSNSNLGAINVQDAIDSNADRVDTTEGEIDNLQISVGALVSNVTTDLSVGVKTATTLDINSSDGTNATLPSATITEAGLMSAADKIALDAISDTDDQVASEVSYTNTTSGLTATDVQAAIDENAAAIGSIVDSDDQTATEVSYTPTGNTTSTDVQSAITEIQTEVDVNTLKTGITPSQTSDITTNNDKVSADGSIDTHSDVDTTTVAPTTGDFLKYDGTNFVPQALVGMGDMLASNNLSDVDNAATSLSNIGGEPAFAKNTAHNKDFGTTAGTVLEGDTTTISAGQAADIVANTAKETNVDTNLSVGTKTSTTVDINSSDGINATIPEATATEAGLLSVAKRDEIIANTTKVGITPTQASDITTNNSKVSADGSVTTHSDVTDAGSGLIITDAERTNLGNAEQTANKGQANGYASLDGSGLVPASQLPSYVDDVLEYADEASFPVTGEAGKIYVDIATGGIFRWTGSVYVEISPDAGAPVASVNGNTGTVVLDTDDVTEAGNKYYTEARVSANSSVAANTAKTGITAQQASDITTNNAKVGITPTQASDITSNNSKISYTDAAAVSANTAKVSADGSIDTHSDVDTTTSTPSVGDNLQWDGSNFVPVTPSAGHASMTLDTDLDVTEQAANLVGQELELLKAGASNDGVMSSEDKVKLDAITGTNTGDQDLSGYSLTTHTHDWDEATGTADSIPFNTSLTKPAHQEGLFFYDKDEHAIVAYNDEADITQQIGREFYRRVRNESGVTITNGMVVYQSGAEVGGEGRALIDLAQANDPAKENVIGVATHDIENNSYGYITVIGDVNDVDTSGLTPGQILYLSPTVAGTLQTALPAEDEFVVEVVTVEKVDAVTGRYNVNIKNRGRLTDFDSIGGLTYWLGVGLDVSANDPENQTVDYTAGSYIINGTQYDLATGGNYDLENTWDASNHYTALVSNYDHRLVIIYVGVDEEIRSIAGTVVAKNEVAQPPALPADSLCISVIEIIKNKDIKEENVSDCRMGTVIPNGQGKVKISPDDTMGTVLEDAIVAGTGIAITKLNTGADEQLEISATGGSSDSVTEDVTQASHGLSVGDPVRHNGTNYILAQSDVAANSQAIGLVTAVADTNNFTVTYTGKVTTLSGLTAGEVHYLDTDGTLTTTEPTISKPILFAISTTEAIVMIERGLMGGTSATVTREPYTWAISGEIKVASGDTDFILPMFIGLAAGQTAKLVKCRYSINSGTSVTAKLQKGGVDITGFTGMSVTTTPASTDPVDVTLADDDELALVVTAVAGTPKNMNFTMFVEYTQ